MENEKKDIKIAVLSIVLAIICLVILGYIIYVRINSEKIKDKPKEPIINQEDPVIEKPQDEIQVTDSLVLSLYEMISKFPEFRLYTPVTYETLTEEIKDKIVLIKLQPNFVCTDELIFVKSTFMTAYKNIFNHEKSSNEGICKEKDGNYQCYVECTEEIVRNVNKYINYKVEDEKIIIYEKYGYLDYLDDSIIYLKPSIDDLETIKSYTSIDEIVIGDIEELLPTYKHTFKRENNNYYWVSSEIVKQ